MRFISPAIFSACCRTSSRSVPIEPDRDRRQRAEAHDLGHDIARLEAEGRHLGLLRRLLLGQSPLFQPCRHPGDDPFGQDLAEPLAELVELDPAPLAEGDAELAVVGPAHEEQHVVDAEVRGDLPDEAHRDLDVLGLRLALDLLEALHRHLPGQLEVRAGRRPEPEHELARIDLREQLGADLQTQHARGPAARREIARDHQPSQADEPVHDLAINVDATGRTARASPRPAPCA